LGFAIVGQTEVQSTFVLPFCFCSSLTEYYLAFVVIFDSSFSIGLQLWADGILFPHHRKALFVGRNRERPKKPSEFQQNYPKIPPLTANILGKKGEIAFKLNLLRDSFLRFQTLFEDSFFQNSNNIEPTNSDSFLPVRELV
jgi:hypothetical protein